jgi:hypothetical protein
MGGAATVNPGRYMSRPDYQTDTSILAQKQEYGRGALEAQLADIGTRSQLFDLYRQTQPLMQDFDAEQTSRQAAQFGLANEARARQGEAMISPETARMRLQLPQQVESATSGEAFKNYMDAWLKNKGISAVSGTGVDPSSSFGRSMLADVSTEEGRKRMLEDIALRQKFVESQQRPTGGLEPGQLIGARMAQESANLGAMSDWQKNIFSGARELGAGLGEAQQNTYDFLNKNMGELLNLSNVQRQNRQAYEQSLYDAAVQGAQSRNAAKAGMISAGAGLGGAAIGAAAIII